MNEWKTPKGTVLYIIDLKGKPYLPVAERLVWFREVHQEWSIQTKLVLGQDSCLATAWIRNTNKHIIAMAHKYEDKKGFADYIEKSETGAVGRALAMCGFGTQFCADELDEKDRLADAPRNVSTQTTTMPPKENAPLPPPIGQVLSDDPGSFKITFGKHKDKTLAMMGVVAVSGYIKWLSEQPKISDAARELIKQGKEFLKKPSTSKEYCDELDEALKSSPPHDQWKDEPWPDAPPF